MSECGLAIYDEDKCAFFALGRNAMYAACALLGLKAGDEILTPAFDCDGSLQPFKVLGMRMQFFRSDPYTFAADIDDIKKRITGRTKLLHIINHFGFPQPWKEILALRQGVGIPILEDNAYSLFSSLDGRPFGSFGDMSIFSLRKNLPLVDGGMLCVNTQSHSADQFRKEGRWLYPTEYPEALRLLIRQMKPRALSNILKKITKSMCPSLKPPPPLYSEVKLGYPDWPSRDEIGKEFSCDYTRPMSKLADKQLNKFRREDIIDIAQKKRMHYKRIAEGLRDLKGVKVLIPALPGGTAPFCVSCLIDSGRDHIFETLRQNYDIMVWPTLPRMVLDNLKYYPEVELLGRKLLQINLPSDKVREPVFSEYLERLVNDFTRLIK